MRVCKWITPWMIAMACFGWMQEIHAADSKLIATDTRIDPVLIVATYSIGPCSQDISGTFIQKAAQRSMATSDKAKQMPTYVFCRYLPQAIQLHLLGHHFDTVLREFDTEPLEASDYAARESSFMQQVLNAPENAQRYVLEYDGTVFDRNLHSFAIISLLSPADAAGKRIQLGRFDLESAQLYDPAGGGDFGMPAAYRLRSPDVVAELIANSMESRCAEKSSFFMKRECPSQLHLTSPGR